MTPIAGTSGIMASSTIDDAGKSDHLSADHTIDCRRTDHHRQIRHLFLSRRRLRLHRQRPPQPGGTHRTPLQQGQKSQMAYRLPACRTGDQHHPYRTFHTSRMYNQPAAGRPHPDQGSWRIRLPCRLRQPSQVSGQNRHQ